MTDEYLIALSSCSLYSSYFSPGYFLVVIQLLIFVSLSSFSEREDEGGSSAVSVCTEEVSQRRLW